MSFFDEADDPPPRPPRTPPRRSRPSGAGRPPRGDQQTIQTRRIVAAVVVVVVIILLALLIHSCDVSASNTALRDYTNSVAGIIRDSNTTGGQVFNDLEGKNPSCTTAANLQNCISAAAGAADKQLSRAKSLSVPGAMQAAHQSLVATLRPRYDAYQVIAAQVQPAQVQNTASQAVQQITTGTARVFSSDVTYTAYAAQQMAAALHAAGIEVGGDNGETIVPSQILPTIDWLDPTYVAGKLGAKVSSSKVNSSQPGQLRGHALNSVSYNGAALVQGQTATITSKAGLQFVLNLTNGGNFPEYDVQCTVSIAGLNDSNSATIATTQPNQTYNCTVTLPTAPTPGTYNVKFGVTPVPGETNKTNNYIEIPIDFTSG